MTEIRSSNLPRFMTCNGWIAYSHLPQEENEVAKEGTAFHELVDLLFKGKKPMPSATNGVFFDNDMYYHAKRILPLIPATALSEQYLEYQPTPQVKITGHYDYMWTEGSTLVIMDIKYGHRVVEVKKNWQLISYAIGEMIRQSTKNVNFTHVKMIVVQPRPHHVDGWIRSVTVTTQDLVGYYQEIVAKCNSVPTLVTSEYCRYCPALGENCPALTRAYNNAVDVVVNDIVQDQIDGKKLSEMLEVYDRIKDIFKIKIEALQDLAKKKIMAGNIVDGFVVEKNYGHRKWKNDISATNFKAITGKDLMKSVSKSPAELEKEGIDQSIVDMFSVSEQRGFKLTKMNASALADKIFNNKKEN